MMCCVQSDAIDESSQVSPAADEVETLKQELLNKQQVCIVIVSSVIAAAAGTVVCDITCHKVFQTCRLTC